MSIETRINNIKNEILGKEISLNPPISLEEILFFEDQYSIELPEEYREFLLKAGNGGDGPPHYKLLDLGSAFILSKGFAKDDKFISEEFPFDNYMVWEGTNLSQEELDRLQQIHKGSLLIGEEGCGIFWLLVISGVERGKIWYLTEVGVQPCAPSLSFLDWYEYWLHDGSDWWREFK